MSQTAAAITLILFFVFVVITAYVSIRLQLRAGRYQQYEQKRANQLALELSPAYQAKLAADRAYQLAQQRQAVDLAIKQADFTLRQHITLHRIPAETYSINEEVSRVISFPSLKPQAAEKAIAGATPPLQIPPAYDLFDIFRHEDITPEHIFLGKSHQDQLYIKASQLHHAAFSASTGYGKTTLIRGIIPQLLHIGHHVIIADLKYTDVTEKGEDWRPIAAHIFEQEPLFIAEGYTLPNIIRREEQIATLLHWLAYPETQRRLDMRASRNYSYPTLDIFLEELVALTVAYPNVTKDILRIISLGRELRLNLFTTAQNMQVSSIGLSGGAREQFTTAWFLGGDEISAAALLDMPRKELGGFLHDNNIILGQGIGMMRNNYILPTAGIVRLGYSSNESIYHLLGRAEDFELSKAEAESKKNRSYSVPQERPRTAVTNSAEEHPRTPTRNTEEPDTEPPGTVFTGVLEEQQQTDCNPFVLFTEEQRTAILAAASQPNVSLRKIRTAAKIGNDNKRWTALKIWLSMNESQEQQV